MAAMPRVGHVEADVVEHARCVALVDDEAFATPSSRIAASLCLRCAPRQRGSRRNGKTTARSAQRLLPASPSPIRTLTVGSLPGDPPPPPRGAASGRGLSRAATSRPRRPTTGREFHPTPKERRISCFVLAAYRYRRSRADDPPDPARPHRAVRAGAVPGPAHRCVAIERGQAARLALGDRLESVPHRPRRSAAR